MDGQCVLPADVQKSRKDKNRPSTLPVSCQSRDAPSAFPTLVPLFGSLT